MKQAQSLSAIFFFFFFAFPLFPFPAFADSSRPGLSDDALMDEVQKNAFQYFVLESDSKTGLVSDHVNNFKQSGEFHQASIAATGFGLAAYAVGVDRNWTNYAAAKERVRRTLDFALHHLKTKRGFFYHFLNPQTGERSKKSELSPIDTTLFLAGAFFAAEYFEDTEITKLANELYQNVDWPWMLNGGKTLALSWDPEAGFNRYHWDHYDESMILYLLAIGSPTYPIPAESWKAIARPVGSYKGHRLISTTPLFTHQYSHIFVDFRNQNDGFADYFENSVQATLANRQFALDHAREYSSYGENSWGLSASDGPFGYHAYGAPPGWPNHDGTVAPTACVSSIVFTPRESLACMRYLYESLGDRLWGQYGFSDAFNLDKKWFDDQVIGIDQGAMLLMIENHRSELIWKTMAKNKFLQDAMKAVGFTYGSKKLPWPDPPAYSAPYLQGGVQVDGYLRDWPAYIPKLVLDERHKENGEIANEKDLSADVRFAWDEEALYLIAKVKDESLVLKHSGKNIWQDDLVELFVDSDENGLYWGGDKDFQIGFRANPKNDQVNVWSWFGRSEDPSKHAKIVARGYADSSGYVIEAAIRWNYLDLRPEIGKVIRLSVAIHDADQDRTEGKLQWFFRNEEEEKRFVLGKVVLSRDPHRSMIKADKKAD